MHFKVLLEIRERKQISGQLGYGMQNTILKCNVKSGLNVFLLFLLFSFSSIVHLQQFPFHNCMRVRRCECVFLISNT